MLFYVFYVKSIFLFLFFSLLFFMLFFGDLEEKIVFCWKRRSGKGEDSIFKGLNFRPLKRAYEIERENLMGDLCIYRITKKVWPY